MRRFLFVLGCLLVLPIALTFLTWWGLNAGLASWLLVRTLESDKLPTPSSMSCTVGDTHIGWDGVISVSELQCHAHDAVASVYAASLDIAALLRRQPQALVIRGASYGDRDVDISGITIDYAPSLGISGVTPFKHATVNVVRLQAGPLIVRGLHGNITPTATGYQIDPLALQIFSGSAQGALTIAHDASDGMRLQLAITELPLHDLASFHPQLFDEATGLVAGSLLIESDPQGINIHAQLASEAPGGSIGAQLLAYLVPYLPTQSADRQQLEAAILAGDVVTFEQASLRVESIGLTEIKIVLNMRIPEYNLHLQDITVDLRMSNTEALWKLMELLSTQ